MVGGVIGVAGQWPMATTRGTFDGGGPLGVASTGTSASPCAERAHRARCPQCCPVHCRQLASATAQLQTTTVGIAFAEANPVPRALRGEFLKGTAAAAKRRALMHTSHTHEGVLVNHAKGGGTSSHPLIQL